MTKPLKAFGTVIGTQLEVVADLGEFVVQDQQVFLARTDDNGRRVAPLPQLAHQAEQGGSAEAAADANDVPLTGNLERHAERADQVEDLVADFEWPRAAWSCRLPARRSSGALFAVVVCDRQRNSFAAFADTDNDELAGLCRLCDQRCIDLDTTW